MFDKEIDIGALIALYFNDEELNGHDQKVLEEWIAKDPANGVLFNELSRKENVQSKMVAFNSPDRDKIWNKVAQGFKVTTEENSVTGKVSLWPRIGIVAAAVLAIFGLFLVLSKQFFIKKLEDVKSAHVISPGKVGATLTLANGDQIVLGDAGSGELATQGKVRIIKKDNGQIVYSTGDNKLEQTEEINKLSTGRGETYMLTLPDQSRVWMNAASSLTYTSGLLKNGIRTVKLQGEAYFEISKDITHPFVVETLDQKVQVLGTHFNISAYQDDMFSRTTLLEGSIKVTSSNNGKQTQAIILKPDQQAVQTMSGIKVLNVEAESYVDWKDGVFNFEDETLQAVMRKVSRWYDVEVIYLGTKNDPQKFSGSVSRSANISNVLKILTQIGGLKFQIEGRKILVTK